MYKCCIFDLDGTLVNSIHAIRKSVNLTLASFGLREITVEEANVKLKEAGANFSLDPNKNPGGGWTKEEMEEGFIPAPVETPWWASMHTFAGAVAWQEEIDKYIPEKDMVYNRPKYHGVEVVKGALRYIYAEDGSCKYQPKSMADYDKDHGRA